MTADDARTITWGSYRTYRTPTLDGMLLRHQAPEVVLAVTGRWPWQWPDYHRGWPPVDRINALVAPRLTEAQRRRRVARSATVDAWLSAGDALAACRTALRTLARGR